MPKPVIYGKPDTDSTIKLCQNNVQNLHTTSLQPSVWKKNSCMEKNDEAQQRKIYRGPDRILQGMCHTWFSHFECQHPPQEFLPTTVSIIHESTYRSPWCSQISVMLNARGMPQFLFGGLSGQSQSLEVTISVGVLGQSQQFPRKEHVNKSSRPLKIFGF